MKKTLIISSIIGLFLGGIIGVQYFKQYFKSAEPTLGAAVSWDGNFSTQILQPMQAFWGAQIRGDHFVSTSTTAINTLPQAFFTQASSTEFCLTGDTCIGVWPIGGVSTGGVSTSTNETAGRVPYWTSNSGTPALLGEIATGTVSSSGGITTTASRYVLNGALTIGCTAATAAATGCLQSADWSNFNNKISSSSLSAGFPLSYDSGTGAFSWIGLASSSNIAAPQVLYATGANTFASVATGTISSSGGITTTAGRAALGGTLAIGCTVADGSNAGCLSATDWSTFNSKQAAISVTWPITLSGATVGFNGLATTSTWTNGQLVYVNSGNTVTSVATTTLSGTANQISISNSPVVIGASGAVLSLPSHVIFPGNFQATQSTTTHATTTGSFYITPLGTAAGTFLAADPTGRVIATTSPSGAPGGSNTQLQFNDNGSFGGAAITYEIFDGWVPALRGDSNGLHILGNGGVAALFSDDTYSRGFSAEATDVNIYAVSDPGEKIRLFTQGGQYDFAGDFANLKYGILDFSSIAATDKRFLLPNLSGTFLLATGTQNFILGNGTSSSATTTNLFATTASSTNLFSTSLTTGLATTSQATTTVLSVSRIASTTALTISGLGNGSTQCLQISGTGAVSGTGSACGGGNSKWATSTATGYPSDTGISPNGAIFVGIGTTTPRWALQIASSTRSQLTLTDQSAGTNLKHWSVRSAGGNLYFATSSDSTFATSTGAGPLTITGNGNVGIGTTNPINGKLEISQISASAVSVYAGANMSSVNAAPTFRAQAYSPSYELLDKDGVQNWYFGLDDNDSDKLKIGRGYGPHQGVAVAITINTSDDVGIGTNVHNSRLTVTGASGASTNADSGVGIFKLTTGTGLSTDNSLLFGVLDDNYSWIQASDPGNQTRNLVLQASGGNVGIGTTSPISMLDIKAATGDGSGIHLERNGWTSKFRIGAVGAEGDDFWLTNNYKVSTGAVDSAGDSGSTFTRLGTNFVSFGTALAGAGVPVERMRIDSSGNVGIATSSPWRKLSVTGTVAVNGLGTGTGGNYVCIDTSTWEILRGNGSACTASSIRFKENIENINYGLASLLKLRPVSFAFKADSNMGEGTRLGFIAEEMATIIPEVVTFDSEGQPFGLDYPVLTAVLTKGVQELYTGIAPMLATTTAYELTLTPTTTVSTTTPWVGTFGNASTGLKDAINHFAVQFYQQFNRTLSPRVIRGGVYAIVGIFDRIFAKEVHTDKLCLADRSGETCITRSQLDALIAGVAAGGGTPADPATLHLNGLINSDGIINISTQ